MYKIERESSDKLSVDEFAALAAVAGIMIPPEFERALPGADDVRVLAEVERSIGRDVGMIRVALAEIDARAGGTFANLDQNRREALINDWYATGGAAAAALGRVVLSAYYRDDRVLRALGHE